MTFHPSLRARLTVYATLGAIALFVTGALLLYHDLTDQLSQAISTELSVRLHDLEAVVKGQRGLLPREEALHDVAVLGLVAVFRGLVADDGHEALLGVLLLDEVLAGGARDPAAEEKLRAGGEGVVREGVFRPEQFRRKPQAGADKGPRRRDLADQRAALLIGILDGGAREVLGGTLRVVHGGAHRALEHLHVFRARPFQRMDVAGDLHGPDAGARR